MAQLSHPNVVAVYDAEETPTGVVLFMEYVAGQTLRPWVQASRRPWAEVVACFVAAGRGLAAAHAKGLLHRDFKPDNVLVAASGEVKVADFGLAKLTAELKHGGPAGSLVPIPTEPSGDPLTRTDAVMGTPRYMAPEQHRDEVLGPAVDQYAFCVALWEVLTGKPPFAGPSVHALLAHKQCGPPPWPDNTAVPRPIVNALLRGLAAEPSQRWPNLDALLNALAYDPHRAKRCPPPGLRLR